MFWHTGVMLTLASQVTRTGTRAGGEGGMTWLEPKARGKTVTINLHTVTVTTERKKGHVLFSGRDAGVHLQKRCPGKKKRGDSNLLMKERKERNKSKITAISVLLGSHQSHLHKKAANLPVGVEADLLLLEHLCVKASYLLTIGSSSPLAFMALILALMPSSMACRQRTA